MIMEFEEMKKIWDSQEEEHVFTINQSVLHSHVVAKQRKGLHIANVSEWMLITVNIMVPVYIIATMVTGKINISMLFLAGWMLLTAAFVANGRYKRTSGSARFDRDLNGDLQFAINVATYQGRLATLGRWNILPLGVLSVTGLIEAEKPLWIAGVLVFFLFIANYAAGWETGFYKSRLHELEVLKRKLEEEV